MNLRSKNSTCFVIQIFLIAWMVFGSGNLLAMEIFVEFGARDVAGEIGSIGEAGEAAEAAAERAFSSIEKAVNKVYNMTGDIGGLRSDLQVEFSIEAKQALEEMKSKLGMGEGKINIDDPNFTKRIEEILIQSRDNFLTKAKSFTDGGISFRERGILNKMPDGNVLTAKAKIVSQSRIDAGNVGIKADSQAGEEPVVKTDVEFAHDEVINAQENIEKLYKAGGKPEEIEAAKEKLASAKKTYKKNAKDELAKTDTDLENAHRSELKAKDNLEKAGNNAINRMNAEREIINAKNDVAEAEQASRAAIQDQAYGEFKQAESALKTAKAELKSAEAVSKDVSGSEEKIAQAKENLKEAEEAFKKADANFKDKTSFLKKGWGRYGNERARMAAREIPTDAWSAVKATGEGVWGGAKWVGEKGWGMTKSTGELLFQAGAFMIPQLIFDQVNAWAQKLALLDTLKTLQIFGNIKMKLPDDLIDEADPIQSKFVYVGVPDKNQKLTKNFLETANYYVSKSEFVDLGTFGITDPNFPHVMLHLDTGFVFVGDGVAYNEGKPTIPLLDTSDEREKNLLEALDDLAGEVKQGPKGESYQMFSMHASGYAGDKNIAALFEKPDKSKTESYPPLLQRILNVLQSGTKFGDYLVQGFRGLATTDKNDIAMWNLLSQGSASETATHPAAPNDPYVGWGIYIYQTKDTPFIKNIRSSISSDDIDQKVAAQDLVDYVVMLNEDYDIVPLQTPQAQLPFNYASYTLNPHAVYMVSLLDPSLTAYEKNINERGVYDKVKSVDVLLSTIDEEFKKKVADKSKVDRIFSQIAQMQQFIGKQAQFGPFSIGSVNLLTTKDLIAKGIYIYKLPGYLGAGIDDYVIALDLKGVVMQLPGKVENFISLVTSRIYDGTFKPKKIKYPYYIMKKSKDAPEQVTTNQQKFLDKIPGAITVCSTTDGKNERAPLYTLFVEGALNPTKCDGKDLPNPPDWAINQYSFATEGKEPLSIKEYLTINNDKDLLGAIESAHNAWRAAFDKANPATVIAQMGPFNFTPAGSLQDIQIKPVSEAAIINQNFVYDSISYPHEYLVMATKPDGSDVGKPYNGQQYAVSLANGYVYSAQAQEGKVPGERVAQKALQLEGPNGILAKAQATVPYSKELLDAIDHSEKVYNARIVSNLWGSKIDFAQFKFYIAKEDYLAGQFIYGDVSKLPSPLDEKNNPIPSVVDQIDNYFVCIERKSSTDSCGSGCPPVMEGGEQATQDGKPLYWHYDFGNELTGDTYAVASLVSGASYDRNNNYLGSYDQFMVKDGKIVDIAGFTTRTFEEIKKKSGLDSVRLQPTITKLLHDLIARIKAEKDELADAEESYNKLYIDLGSNLKTNLDNDKLPYIDNPNLLPRYLKYYGDKYYAVTPGYVSSPKIDSTGKEIDVPSDGRGPDRMYIDYNLDVKSTRKDAYSGKDAYGMIYNSDGKAVVLLGPDKTWVEDPKTKTRKKTIVGPGWALQVARAFAGINVDKNGKQTRTIGITSPSVPMGDGYFKQAGFKPIIDTKHGNTFEFLYHTKLDTFFVKVTTPNKAYYINLSSGYAYNTDGKPRWFESPVYTTKDSGDMLFIGTDQFDILKVALYKAKTKEFAYYTMVGNFAAQMTEAPYNARGSYCVMVNDEDPSSQIKLFQAIKTTSGGATDGTGVPFPYYLVWDVSNVNNVTPAPEPVLLGQFKKDEAQAYSLLLYAQTRNKGESIEKGKFVDDDNYIDPTAEIKKPKTVGIVFDKAHTITFIIYQNQLCPMKGSSIAVKNTDGSSRTVGVTQSKKSLVPAGTSPLADLTAEWISFADGSKIYDYEYDIYALSTQPEVQSIEQSASHLNLYNLKHGDRKALEGGSPTGGFGLNVTTYVPAFNHNKDVKKEGPKEQISGVALASILHADDPAPAIVFPPKLLQDFINQADANKLYIKVDSTGSLFINNIVSGRTSRFVYILGQKQDNGMAYATPGLEGWSVDLSNGILYDTDGFPSGISLNAPQLYTLLDTLHLSVTYDKDGNPQLSYRFGTAEAKTVASKVTPRPLARATRSGPRAQMKRVKKPSRVSKPSLSIKQASPTEWSMPEPVRPLPQALIKPRKR